EGLDTEALGLGEPEGVERLECRGQPALGVGVGLLDRALTDRAQVLAPATATADEPAQVHPRALGEHEREDEPDHAATDRGTAAAAARGPAGSAALERPALAKRHARTIGRSGRLGLLRAPAPRRWASVREAARRESLTDRVGTGDGPHRRGDEHGARAALEPA